MVLHYKTGLLLPMVLINEYIDVQNLSQRFL